MLTWPASVVLPAAGALVGDFMFGMSSAALLAATDWMAAAAPPDKAAYNYSILLLFLLFKRIM